MKPSVAIARCNDYDRAAVYESVKRVVGLLGGMEKFVKPRERILLKPNLLAGKPPESAVTTHPEIVRAVAVLVREAGATPFVGDSSARPGTLKNAKAAGLISICDELGVEFVELKTPVSVENADGLVFKRLEIAEEALIADGIINLPKLKTHVQMFLTMGVKNVFGCVPGMKKAQWHLAAGSSTDTFAAMILDLHEFLKPRLTLMDGIVAMEGNGPGSGDPRALGLVFASGDALALDTVAAKVLGTTSERVPILKAATKAGLASCDPTAVEIRGEEPGTIKDFKFPPLVNIDFAAMFPYFIAKRLKRALTSRPHVDKDGCTLCSVCVSVCPVEAMERKSRIIIDYESCIRCYCCQESCPKGAISAKEGWLKKILPGL
jgi:uncharacterized protein (DUF362 family)/Pyruvate/2-oxoacid:ferredoxin oxidoreductase delta subunit